jgi:uncharacterized membrane protein
VESRRKKCLNFDTSKNLGGIGAILMFIGFIMPFVQSFGLLLSLVGLILVLVGLKGFADYYTDAGIFNNFLYGSIAGVVGVVVAVATAFVAVLTSLSSFIQTLYPGWNGDWTSIPSSPPDVSGIMDLSAITPFLTAILVVLVILFFTAIIVAIFMRKSLSTLSTKAGVGLFGTTGLLLLIGAVLTIIAIGFILIWISMLIMAIAFFQMKPQQTQATT